MIINSTKEGEEPVKVYEEPKKKAKKVKATESVPEIKTEPIEDTEIDTEEVKREEKQEKATQKAVKKALREQEILNKAKDAAIIHAREVLASEKQQLKDDRKRKRDEKKAEKEGKTIEKPVKKVKIEEKVEKPVKKESNEPPGWFKSYLATQASPVKKPVTATPPPSPVKVQSQPVPPPTPRPSLVQRRSFDMYSQMFPQKKGVTQI